jgi:hypothetical protein
MPLAKPTQNSESLQNHQTKIITESLHGFSTFFYFCVLLFVFVFVQFACNQTKTPWVLRVRVDFVINCYG